MTEQEALQWSSHLAPLLACVAVTEDKPVLEIGAGYFSTPILHTVCGAQSRVLFTVENDQEWRLRFADRYESPLHAFKETVQETKAFCDDGWGVVFIDGSPGGEARRDHFARFLPRANFVVVHDYWRENREMIHPVLKEWNANFTVVVRPEPPTLVASVLHHIPAILRHQPI